MNDYGWLVWLMAFVIGLVVLFAQIRLFYIDAKLSDIFDKMEQMMSEMRKAGAAESEPK